MPVERSYFSLGGEVYFILALLPSEEKNSESSDDYECYTTQDTADDDPRV